MKKYLSPGFLLLSILLAFLMIMNKPSADMEENDEKIPYVKTMMLMSQTAKS